MSIPRTKDELLSNERRLSIETRFTKLSSNAPYGCIEWLGVKDSWGYGSMRIGEHKMGAHKVSVLLDGRDIPDGAVVMHSCDNPSCVNPEHLTVSTQSANIKDCVAKGRHASNATVSARAAAKLAGSRFYDGAPCKIHGTTRRKTINGGCVDCAEDYRVLKNLLRKQPRNG